MKDALNHNYKHNYWESQRQNSKEPLNRDNAIFQRKINKRISIADDLINSVFTPSFLRARLIECFEATSSRNKPVFIVGHEQQCPRARRTSRFRKAILVGPRPMLPRRGVAVSHVFSRPCEYKLSTVQSYWLLVNYRDTCSYYAISSPYACKLIR